MKRIPSHLLILAVCYLASCTKPAPVAKKTEGGGVVKVRMAPASSRDIQRTVESVGTLFPFDETIISAEVDGKVDQVKIDLGDSVSKGQLMVHISEEEQRYLLAQNEAQLRQSMERLGLQNEQDRVKDVTQTPDARRAQADLTEADQRFRRVKSLAEQGIGSAQDLDQAQTRLNAARAAFDTTLNQTRNLIQEVERFRAGLELQRKKLRDTGVYAPFAAQVKERSVTVGQFVRANTPLVTLVKNDPLRLRLEIPERMSPWMKIGQRAEVSVEAFEDQKFSGNISRISPVVDQQKRTFIVEVLLENSKGMLKAGSYARARIPTNKVETVVTVPLRAVSYVMGSNRAYIVKENVVESREVKLGDRFETEIEILEGVKSGDTVATSQLTRLDTGSKVGLDTSAEKKTVSATAK
jgi:multidrug efflux pump subunit AcrA (membrane-fusion protein)